MERAPLNPNVTEELDFGDYTRQRVEIQTEPGIIMPMYVLIPKGAQPPYPAVIAAHGHCSMGKYGVANATDVPGFQDTILAANITDFNYAYGVELVRAGFITFCPDARGHGERMEADLWERRKEINVWSCGTLNELGRPLGQTVLGMLTWDIHRLIDYIELRSDCRAGGIGCAGLSGGGLQTVWAAALDQRIRCAVVSGFIRGVKDLYVKGGLGCSCSYAPGLHENFDTGDIGALIAPRPLLVETGDRDELNGANGLDNVYSQVEIMRRAYRLLDAEELLQHDVFEGGHRWNGVQAVPWMVRFLAG